LPERRTVAAEDGIDLSRRRSGRPPGQPGAPGAIGGIQRWALGHTPTLVPWPMVPSSSSAESIASMSVASALRFIR